MKRTVLATAVGLFVILGVAIGFLGYQKVVRDADDRGGYQVYAYMEDATGLIPDSHVLFRGYPVGTLLNVGMEPDPKGLMRIRVDIRLNSNLRLREGVRDPDTGAWINGTLLIRRQASLIGDYYLDLIPGTAGEVITPGGMVRRVESRSGIQRALNQVDRIGEIIPRLDAVAQNMEAITGSFREVLAGSKGVSRLEEMTANLSASARDIRKMSAVFRKFSESPIFRRAGDIDRVIRNSAKVSGSAVRMSANAERSLKDIMLDLRTTTRTVRDLLAGKRGDVEDSIGSVRGTLKKVESSLSDMNAVLSNLKTITERVKMGEGTLGHLVTDDRLARDFQGVVADIRKVTKKVGRWNLQWGLQMDYYQKQDQVKSAFTLKLQPSMEKYYLLRLVDDPRGSTSSSTTVTESNDPSLPPVLTEQQQRTTGALKISLQFARRYGPLTGRVGLFENTGGVGTDLQFWGDRISLTTEFYDFGAENRPILKVWAGFQVIPHVSVMIGGDNMLNNDRRDFFAGLYLFFTDNDLMTLMAAGPQIKL